MSRPRRVGPPEGKRTNPQDLRLCLRHDFRSFLHFAYTLAHPGQPLADGWHLDVIADALVARPPGSGGRLILNAPPRSLKSFCVSVAWPLFLLARHHDLKVTVIAGTQELAAELAEVRERLLRSPRLLGVFPNLRFRRTASGLLFDSGGRLAHTFVARSQIGRGSDVMIIDDPLAPSHADDEGRRTAVNDWYAKEAAPRLNSQGAVVVLVMQRLHLDDLSGHLLKRREAWTHLVLPAIARENKVYLLASGRAHTHHKGEALSPERASVTDLRAKLMDIGGCNFLAQYCQAPSHHERDTYVEIMLDSMMPLPGYEHLPRPKMGFFSVPVTRYVLADYFGEPDPFQHPGFREQTRDEFELEMLEEQARMAAEAEEEASRIS